MASCHLRLTSFALSNSKAHSMGGRLGRDRTPGIFRVVPSCSVEARRSGLITLAA